MTEKFFSGYCRVIDSARTVTLDEDGADCRYPACDFAPECPVAAALAQEIDIKISD